MSEIVMTERERIEAVERLGYTASEAQFLCCAGLHSGFFLRRQYSQFLGKEDGGSITRLVQKALGAGHARATTWRQNTQVYHLCSRPFYRALGVGDNRNRRMRELPGIKNKVMTLDLILACRDRLCLATESEKVNWFTRHNVAKDCFPSTVYKGLAGAVTPRYFVEKFPIFVTAANSAMPTASFAFVDEGAVGLFAFQTFLTHYRPLFSALVTFDVIYVAATNLHFEAAKKSFERFAVGKETRHAAAGDLRGLFAYFEMRRQYETGQHQAFDREKLLQFRNARDTFQGQDNEALFAAWKTGRTAAVTAILDQKTRLIPPLHGTMSTHLLEHDYSLFATVVTA